MQKIPCIHHTDFKDECRTCVTVCFWMLSKPRFPAFENSAPQSDALWQLSLARSSFPIWVSLTGILLFGFREGVVGQGRLLCSHCGLSCESWYRWSTETPAAGPVCLVQGYPQALPAQWWPSAGCSSSSNSKLCCCWGQKWGNLVTAIMSWEHSFWLENILIKEKFISAYLMTSLPVLTAL